MQDMANASQRGQAQLQLRALINHAPTAAGAGPATAQLRTDILHQSGTADFGGASGTVGLGMVAKLDPNDHVVGTGTNPSEDGDSEALYRKVGAAHPGSYARGHLLNHDLGGYGVNENLYPITAGANARHSVLVEQDVKKYLHQASAWNVSGVKAKAKKKHRVGVQYEVNVLGSPASAQFDCQWKYFPIAPVGSTPIDEQAKSAVIASSLDGEKDPYFRAGHEIGLEKWSHGNRKGTLDFHEKARKGGRIRVKPGAAGVLKDASAVTVLSPKILAEQRKWARENPTELSDRDKAHYDSKETKERIEDREAEVRASLPYISTRSGKRKEVAPVTSNSNDLDEADDEAEMERNVRHKGEPEVELKTDAIDVPKGKKKAAPKRKPKAKRKSSAKGKGKPPTVPGTN